MRAVAKSRGIARPPGALGITIGGEVKATSDPQDERESSQPPHHGGVGFAGGSADVIPDPNSHIRFGSDESVGGLAFGRDTYEEQDDRSSQDRGMSATPTCHGGWNSQPATTAIHKGRDTLGFAFQLGTATLGHTRCSLGAPCDEDCGYGTGCDAGCATAHGQGSVSSDPYGGVVTGTGTGIAGIHGGVPGGYPAGGPGGGKPGGNVPWRPGGPPGGGGGGGGGGGYRGSFGLEGMGGDQLNFFITFLLEVLGVLV